MQSLITCLYCSTDLAEFTIGSSLDARQEFYLCFCCNFFPLKNTFKCIRPLSIYILEQTAMMQRSLTPLILRSRLDVASFISLLFMTFLLHLYSLPTETFKIQFAFELNRIETEECYNGITKKIRTVMLLRNNF